MSVDPLIKAKTSTVNLARTIVPDFKLAGIANLQGGATFACSKTLIGWHAQASQHRQLYRDNRQKLPNSHFYAKHNPLSYPPGADPRRPCTAASVSPIELRYEERLREQECPSPPPMIRLNVTSTGNVDTDPPAGVPGPIGAMRIKNECWGVSAGRGVSSPSNLAKMKGKFRCRFPFERNKTARPVSAPPGTPLGPLNQPPLQPGVPRTTVPPGYSGYAPGWKSDSAGYSKSAVMQNQSMWEAASNFAKRQQQAHYLNGTVIVPAGAVEGGLVPPPRPHTAVPAPRSFRGLH